MPDHTAYALVNRESDGSYEYHVHCRLAPHQHLEFVAPGGEVVAVWPPPVRRHGDQQFVAHGDRFFHQRGDLTVRVAVESVDERS